MKNRNKIILLLVILILIVLIISGIIIYTNKKKKNINNLNGNYNENDNEVNITENNQLENIKNLSQSQEIATKSDVNTLKSETGLQGNTELYDITKDYDGRNTLTIKASVKYKVAFAGIIKAGKPTMNELDNILNKNHPKENGIWVEKNSRDKFLKIINSSSKTNSTYIINNDGFLKIENKNNQTEEDKKIENAINANKQYIIDISNIYYIVDDVTGEILDYNFVQMDEFQPYEYVEDGSNMIIFVNENKNSQLSNDEIFDSILYLL